MNVTEPAPSACFIRLELGGGGGAPCQTCPRGPLPSMQRVGLNGIKGTFEWGRAERQIVGRAAAVVCTITSH